MKRLITSGIVTVSITCIVLLIGVSDLAAQENKSPIVTDFLIEIEQSPETVKLTCREGCAWENLEFSRLAAYQPQSIDQYGMVTESIKEDTEVGEDLSYFQFELERSHNEIRLTGRKGTAWNSLTFNCPANNCIQPIDEYGMVPADSLKTEG